MSSERTVLGVDFGSTTAKAVLASERGEILDRTSVPQRVDRGADGRAEQDPDGWWADLATLIRRVGADRPTANLSGLAVSGHLPTLALADERGRPLAAAMLYADRRADAFIERACELSGQRLTGDELLQKLLWLAASNPDLVRATRRVFNLVDFLVHRLTGARGLDVRTAMRSGLFDPTTMDWRRDVAAGLGLDPDALPPVRPGSEVAGRVSSDAAADLGIPAGTPVLVGLGDTPAELLGCGVVRAGEAMVYYGTTTTLDVATHDVEAFFTEPRLIGEWAPYREVGYAVLGPAIGWAARGFATRRSDEDAAGAGAAHGGADLGAAGVDAANHTDPGLGALDAEAAALPLDEDAPMVVPRFDAHASGGGREAPSAIIGLQPAHGRAHLHRALLESFGFVARAGLETSGLATTTHRFVAAGGGARSTFWRQLVSDTLGAPQAWPHASDAALGMAMLTARTVFGADVFGRDLTQWLGAVETTNPDPVTVELQARRYARWLHLRAALSAEG